MKGLILVVLVLGTVLVLLFLAKVRREEDRQKPAPKLKRRADSGSDG